MPNKFSNQVEFIIEQIFRNSYTKYFFARTVSKRARIGLTTASSGRFSLGARCASVHSQPPESSHSFVQCIRLATLASSLQGIIAFPNCTLLEFAPQELSHRSAKIINVVCSEEPSELFSRTYIVSVTHDRSQYMQRRAL